MKKEDIEGQRKELQDYVAVHGVSGYKQFLDNHLNQWMKYPLRIAVTNSSGHGKSSLINTLRGLKSKSPGAAKVGVVECTNTVTKYPDPKHPSLIYYDLPGVGTPSYPRDQYFEIIKKQTKDGVDICDFDFFLIVSTSRFTENDMWLVEQTQNTKFTDNEKWDFPLMIKSLICDHPDLKHNAIVISITVNCKDVIREKAKTLRQQIWKVALVNSLIGAMLIPSASTATGLATSTMML
ncbi:unnamed protein product, partial [Rotaria sp. Silwood1]